MALEPLSTPSEILTMQWELKVANGADPYDTSLLIHRLIQRRTRCPPLRVASRAF